jgi:nucleoid-associated protein YgaU
VTTGAPVTLLRIHTIVRGDTLSGISRQYYGTPNRWQDILAANRDVLRSERDLIAGRTLRIP